MIDVTATTIPAVFDWRTTQQPETTALKVKVQGTFTPITWQQYRNDVFRAAAVLSRWITPGARVVHVSENRYEWLVADIAITALGAIHVPLHATLTLAQLTEQAKDAEPCCLIRSTADGLHLPDTPILSYHDSPLNGAQSWSELLQTVTVDQGELAIQNARPSVTADSIATILYTSGTTGESKGVVLTHGNLISNAIGAYQVFYIDASKRRLNFLPLSHIFARTCDFYTWLVGGFELVLAESKDTVVPDCQATAPHIVTGVPYFYERVQRSLQAAGVAGLPGVLKKTLGGSIELCCSGGAPLADETFDYYASQAIPLLQGYGLTETSPVLTANTPAQLRRGSVGRAIADVQLRIAEDGEICAKGPNIMQGYWRKPQATAEVLQDGWFSTGDIGHIDDDGYLWITGRKKELIVTAAGKKIAPVMVEALLNQDPLIAQSLVFGDRQKYLVALIVPDPVQLGAKLRELGLDEQAWKDVSQDAAVRELFQAAIRARLKDLSHYEQVQCFQLLSQPFAIETGELTAKLSMRRQVIVERHWSTIQALYDSQTAQAAASQ
jgi:long-chain acyl-CoA synthetase